MDILHNTLYAFLDYSSRVSFARKSLSSRLVVLEQSCELLFAPLLGAVVAGFILRGSILAISRAHDRVTGRRGRPRLDFIHGSKLAFNYSCGIYPLAFSYPIGFKSRKGGKRCGDAQSRGNEYLVK